MKVKVDDLPRPLSGEPPGHNILRGTYVTYDFDEKASARLFALEVESSNPLKCQQFP